MLAQLRQYHDLLDQQTHTLVAAQQTAAPHDPSDSLAQQGPPADIVSDKTD